MNFLLWLLQQCHRLQEYLERQRAAQRDPDDPCLRQELKLTAWKGLFARLANHLNRQQTPAAFLQALARDGKAGVVEAHLYAEDLVGHYLASFATHPQIGFGKAARDVLAWHTNDALRQRLLPLLFDALEEELLTTRRTP